MLEDFDRRVSYRMVFSVSRAIVNTRRSVDRVLDPDNAVDVAEVKAGVLAALSPHGDRIPPEIFNQAMDDAMNQRPPRW